MKPTILHCRKNRIMLEVTSKGGERSSELLEIPCRCYRLRTGFLLLLITSLLCFYYLNVSDVLKFWSTMVQILYNTSYASASSNATFITPTLQVPNATKPTAKEEATTHVAKPCVTESTYYVAYPCGYHYILNEPEKCKKDSPFLVLMVPVAPNNREARDAVRRTWGSEKLVMEKVVRLFFLLGLSGQERTEEQHQTLLQESEEYHDIVQSDFLDTYKNLTIKTMVILEWLQTYCQNATYAMKIDSDMFLNLNVLLNMLLHAPIENYMTGLVADGAQVLRDPKSKWYLPKDAFPEDFYPPYALGLGYVLSLDLPKKLVEIAGHVKAVHIEDVYLGLCMRQLGIPFTRQTDQTLFNVFPVPYERCRFSKLIATTTVSVQNQISSWEDLKQKGPC